MQSMEDNEQNVEIKQILVSARHKLKQPKIFELPRCKLFANRLLFVCAYCYAPSILQNSGRPSVKRVHTYSMKIKWNDLSKYGIYHFLITVWRAAYKADVLIWYVLIENNQIRSDIR